MNWRYLKLAPWLDTRVRFVAAIPQGGCLLDLGASDGETLGHMAELRSDLRFFAVDLKGFPERYPAGCQFHRANLEQDRLPWPGASMDAITCMHLLEHLNDIRPVLAECRRLLKPGGRAYFETPHPKTVTLSSPRGKAAGTFTLNFYDDATHVRPVAIGALAGHCRRLGLEVVDSGISRNWLFAASYPLWLLLPASRKKFTARIHWTGWSAYLVCANP